MIYRESYLGFQQKISVQHLFHLNCGAAGGDDDGDDDLTGYGAYLFPSCASCSDFDPYQSSESFHCCSHAPPFATLRASMGGDPLQCQNLTLMHEPILHV